MKIYIPVNKLTKLKKVYVILSDLNASNYTSDMISIETKESGLDVIQLSLKEAFAAQLYDIVIKRGLLLKDLAEGMNITKSKLTQMKNEKGSNKMQFKLLDLIQIAEILQCKIQIEEKSIIIIEK